MFSKEKKKDLLIWILILNANFLYVRLDKDNVSLSNPAERGVQGGKSSSSLNLV